MIAGLQRESTDRAAASPGSPVRLELAEFETLRQLIHAQTGISLSPTKRVLLESRLSRRLRALQLESFAEYCDVLDRDLEGELVPLINCVTTNKTEFFRERHHFDFLRDEILPAAEARAAQTGRRRLRIWSAGCSTGEEPYTLAMVLREWLRGRSGWDVRILASDIDTNVLAAAGEGLYDADRLDAVPADLRARWTAPCPDQPDYVRMHESLRALITFRRINFVEDAWAIRTRFDVIFCRNVIIYFNRETQTTLLNRFATMLEPHGHMIIGHSESLAWLSDTFSSVRGRPTVYALAGAKHAAPAPAYVAPRLQPRTPAPEPQPTEYLGIGDVFVSREARVVRTVLGTCVTAALFDPDAGVGGANHFLTPQGPTDDAASPRFGEAAMTSLCAQVVALGAKPERLRAKLFGGAPTVAGSQGAELAARNIAFARAFLADRHIPIVAERLGGQAPLEVVVYLDTGRVLAREAPIDTCAHLLAPEGVSA